MLNAVTNVPKILIASFGYAKSTIPITAMVQPTLPSATYERMEQQIQVTMQTGAGAGTEFVGALTRLLVGQASKREVAHKLQRLGFVERMIRILILSVAPNARKTTIATSGFVKRALVVTSGAGCESFLQLASLPNLRMRIVVEDGRHR
jgi:hypothetical protein